MITGVICEFNPLHKGHTYLLDCARVQGADTVICAMSGNYVQRGDFAVIDKFARAEMALSCGADLVLELPTPWAMSGAENFARGGVALLNGAGCTNLLFGSECGNLPALEKAAENLLAPDLMEDVRRELTGGVTFAAARQAALQQRIGADATLLESPNNTLGIEYLKAIHQLEVNITPSTVARKGTGYHGEAQGEYTSAEYLRKLLKNKEYDRVFSLMPSKAAAILQRETAQNRLVDIKNTERAILAYLRRMQPEDLAVYDSSGEGLYHRLYEAIRNSATWEELLTCAKTKRYPMARIRRMALSAYLAMEGVPEKIPYFRVLAANEKGRAHLRGLRRDGVPILTKAADVSSLGGAAEALFREEARRTDLYAMAYVVPALPGADWRYTPLMK